MLCPHCYRFILKYSFQAEVKLVSAYFHTSSYSLPHNQLHYSTNRNKIFPSKYFSQKPINVLFNRGVQSWSEDNHYTTLGVPFEATQKQIRNAYIKLSKEFHPDHNIGKSEQEIEKIHNRFVKINTAYSVLGNVKEKRSYDLSVIMRQDPRWRDHDGVTVETDSPNPYHNMREMSFEERVAAAGYPKQDPDFYKKRGNYHKKVVVYCIIFMIVGGLVQAFFIYLLYTRHQKELNAAHAANTEILVEARARASQYTTRHDQFVNLFGPEVIAQIDHTYKPKKRLNRKREAVVEEDVDQPPVAEAVAEA